MKRGLIKLSSILILFETKHRKSLLECLEKYLDNRKLNGISKEQYLLLCKAQNIEPNPELIPVDFSDFPDIVHIAFEIYNQLEDRFQFVNMEKPAVFIGKEKSILKFLFDDIYLIPSQYEKKLILEILNIIDKHAVKTAIDKLKQKRNMR